MIKEAIEKIVSLATPKTYEINGDTYTTESLNRVSKHIDKPTTITFTSLDAIVQAVKAEIERDEIAKPLFVNVVSHKKVNVFTTYREDNMCRDYLYTAEPYIIQEFPQWSYHDDAIIMLRSRFVQNEDIDYLLGLLSRISSDDSVMSEDNGVTQKVSATVGIALREYSPTKTRVLLAPFRTFLEVEQPESEFVLRVKSGDKESGEQPQIGIIEADGGAWVLKARANIAEYFRLHLKTLIELGQVIVAE